MTVKGLEHLKTCDVVIYDRLASDRLLEHLKDGCVRIYVGKEPGHHSKTQEEINHILTESAGKFHKVVRLKGGDPFVFGRGGEEVEELIRHQIPFEVVPGVTSAVAVPELAGIPVTHRGLSRSFHVITGHTKDTENTLTDNYETLAKLDGTLVFLMGLSNLKQITDNLIKYGMEAGIPAAVICSGTTINEKTVRGTLGDIADRVKTEELTPPAIFVVGAAAALEYVNSSASPLSGVKIGIAGTANLREKLEKSLTQLGAGIITVCDMQVVKTEGIHRLEEELWQLKEYQWIVFTSANAIRLFFETMQLNSVDRRMLSRIKFAVIGSGTKQVLEQYGYLADFIPGRYTSRELAEEFAAIAGNDRILIPRALQGSGELTEILTRRQRNVTEIPIYDVRGTLTADQELLDKLDCLVFASASGINTFFEETAARDILLHESIVLACMGEVTAAELNKYHREAQIIAQVSSAEGLTEEIAKYYKQRASLKKSMVSKEQA